MKHFLLMPRVLWLAFLLPVSGEVLSNDYGEIGLIDTPSARMRGDAQLSVLAAFDRAHDSYSITYQALPWLEATFRYSGSFNVTPNQRVYWDRNYGFKALLWEENLYLPQVAFGVRDLIGTGVFGSEYLVASKRFDNLDVSLGIGWGRLAGKGLLPNPLNLVDDRFDFRPLASSEVANAGTIRNYYFRGDVGFFGGLSYQLGNTWELLAEINPDEYNFSLPSNPGSIQPSSPLSVGARWQAAPNLALSLSFQHMDQIGFSFESSFNTSAISKVEPSENFISSLYIPQSQLPPQIDKRYWYDRLLYDVERSGLVIVEGSVSSDGTQAELVIGNTGFSVWSGALNRHIALADLHLPATVKTIFFIVEEEGHRLLRLEVPRPSTIPAFYAGSGIGEISSGQRFKTPQNQTGFATGNVVSTIGVKQRLQLFDPDDPARFQLYLSIGSEYLINKNWIVKSSLAIDLDNNFDESRRAESDSQLPNVRTGVVKYLNEGASGIESLSIEGRGTLGSTVHYRLFGGILESMYSGVGGELLHWNPESRLAFGASLSYVTQRAYNRGLRSLDYQTLTGFVSAYWATPWYNYDVAIHAGKYLARDIGATVDLRRTFRNGWQIGVFASLTDVPFDVFGEGSFDKGFFFQVPLDAIFGNGGRSKVSTRLRPVLRDGGQRLEDHSGTIFWTLRESRYDSVVPPF